MPFLEPLIINRTQVQEMLGQSYRFSDFPLKIAICYSGPAQG